jgi:hypothetical protein
MAPRIGILGLLINSDQRYTNRYMPRNMLSNVETSLVPASQDLDPFSTEIDFPLNTPPPSQSTPGVKKTPREPVITGCKHDAYQYGQPINAQICNRKFGLNLHPDKNLEECQDEATEKFKEWDSRCKQMRGSGRYLQRGSGRYLQRGSGRYLHR